MTTYRMFRCNLCGDYLAPTDSTAKEGHGVYFNGGGDITFKRVSECERHICHQCAKCVHDEFRKVSPASENE